MGDQVMKFIIEIIDDDCHPTDTEIASLVAVTYCLDGRDVVVSHFNDAVASLVSAAWLGRNPPGQLTELEEDLLPTVCDCGRGPATELLHQQDRDAPAHLRDERVCIDCMVALEQGDPQP